MQCGHLGYVEKIFFSSACHSIFQRVADVGLSLVSICLRVAEFPIGYSRIALKRIGVTDALAIGHKQTIKENDNELCYR